MKANEFQLVYGIEMKEVNGKRKKSIPQLVPPIGLMTVVSAGRITKAITQHICMCFNGK